MTYYTREVLHSTIFSVLDRPGPVCFEFRERVRLFLEDYNPKKLTEQVRVAVGHFVDYVNTRGKQLGFATWDLQYIQAVHTLCVGKMPIYYRNAWVTPGVHDVLGMDEAAQALPTSDSFDRLYGYMMCLDQYIRKHGIHPADLQSMMVYIANIKTALVRRDVSVFLLNDVRLFEREFYSYMKKVMTDVEKIEERVLHWIKRRHDSQ